MSDGHGMDELTVHEVRFYTVSSASATSDNMTAAVNEMYQKWS